MCTHMSIYLSIFLSIYLSISTAVGSPKPVNAKAFRFRHWGTVFVGIDQISSIPESCSDSESANMLSYVLYAAEYII